MACNDCHEPSRNGSTLAMPQPAKCMLCHASIATDKPDIQRLADAAKNNQIHCSGSASTACLHS